MELRSSTLNCVILKQLKSYFSPSRTCAIKMKKKLTKFWTNEEYANELAKAFLNQIDMNMLMTMF